MSVATDPSGPSTGDDSGTQSTASNAIIIEEITHGSSFISKLKQIDEIFAANKERFPVLSERKEMCGRKLFLHRCFTGSFNSFWDVQIDFNPSMAAVLATEDPKKNPIRVLFASTPSTVHAEEIEPEGTVAFYDMETANGSGRTVLFLHARNSNAEDWLVRAMIGQADDAYKVKPYPSSVDFRYDWSANEEDGDSPSEEEDEEGSDMDVDLDPKSSGSDDAKGDDE